MSGITKVLLATVLSLPLVAFVTGVLVAPETPAPDRSRPVIIGNVDDGSDERPTDPGRPAPSERPGPSGGPRDDDADDRGDRDDSDDADDRPQGRVTVVTPAPQDLDDDDDGVGDDDSDGDDETDDDDGGGDD
jgi:hypothetical protein